MTGVNLVVVRGECAQQPEVRMLSSGRRLASLALRVRAEGSATLWVPVTVWEPAAWVEDLGEGDDVVVVGRVRRRFFALASGERANRVDVEATFVGRGRQRRPLAGALRRAEAALAALTEEEPARSPTRA
ncbi:MAG: single-stranded DNA-binding protein [Actinobacteria bacterium]|nr:single-stranded DNA-binding protein [Actinomycetota bacterium]